MLMQLANGVLATYQQCHFTPDYWRNYTVIGTEGRLENFGDEGGADGQGVVRRRSGYRADADRSIEVTRRAAHTAGPTSRSWPSSCSSSATAHPPSRPRSTPVRPSPRDGQRPCRCVRTAARSRSPGSPRAGRLVRGRPGFRRRPGFRGRPGLRPALAPFASYRRVDVVCRIVLPAGRSLHRVMQGRSGLNERDGMGADGRLLRLFEGHRLTPTQRRIAHCMVRRAPDAPFLSSVELAELAGVSQPSVTRFAVALGFDGYPALRRHLRETARRTARRDGRGRGQQRVPAGGVRRDREPAPALRAAERPRPGRTGRRAAGGLPPAARARAAGSRRAGGRIRATSPPRSTPMCGC